MMSNYRNNPPTEIGGSPVVTIKDYQKGEAIDVASGTTTPIDMERSNVLQFLTADSTTVSVRPSGTEPKIKFYFSVHTPLSSVDQYAETEKKLDEKIESIKNELGLTK